MPRHGASIRLLWLITGFWMLQPLSTDLYLASLPELASSFRVPPATVQLTLSMFALGVALSQLVSGPLSDRFGRRPVLLAGLLIYIAASMTCSLATDIDALIAARFALAAGSCTVAVIARAVVRDAYPVGEGAHVVARSTSVLAVALLLAPVVGAQLQATFGWRANFALLTLAGAALALASVVRFAKTMTQRNPRAIQPTALLRNYAALLRSPAFWAYALPGALSFGMVFVYISSASFALIDVLGVPARYFGYCFALGVLGYLVGTQACRRMLPRYGLSRTLRLGSTVSLAAGTAFAAGLALGVQHWATVVVAHFLVTLAHGINSPCAQSGAVAPFPEKAGTAAALLGSLTMLSAFLFATLVGASYDGTLRPLATVSALLAVALFVAERLLSRYRLLDEVLR
ncbi:multidrug effflux MFS transporter [Aromatoleum buckelii]|uniref:Bcr/CflA family efflux transporter n=1 Tax=Aromatoleum buckelii TaxID=200254 RepID=A0ABX1N3Z6_9RHOO|nr:multidrug effflux MFS transporter [Aromatoleum buckelii]MCK0511494.1 multidrug effflux MFS transporter [Aromatoleum buckelii]